MQNEESYRRVKKRVEARISFYIHAAVFIVANFLLIIINLITSSQYLWFKWPLMGWSIGVQSAENGSLQTMRLATG